MFVCARVDMARILAIDTVDHSLKSALSGSLRIQDDVIVLPSAHRSVESGAFKGCAMKLNGVEGELDPGVFSSAWFSGVSVIPVPDDVAIPLLKDPSKRAAALAKLNTAIVSEMEGADVQVGPELDGDERDRDVEPWEAGLDGPGACVGLYSAQQSRAPDTGITGMHRTHSMYFLVCKAGGGIAAQTFHSRLTSALSKGKSLDECLKDGSEPGPQALRRVSIAAQRNRARILDTAAKAIGFSGCDSIGDNASPPNHPYRMAIPVVNVHTNSLREVESGGVSTWQYAAGCVDGGISQGLLSSSNPQEGFLMFTDSIGGFKPILRNQAGNCLPFASVRIASNRDVVMKAADAHKRAIQKHTTAHPDSAWIRERFAWRSMSFGIDMEPCALWGSYGSEEFLAQWGRELGIATCRVMRLQPEIVCIAAVEPARLRAAAKHVQSSGGMC